MDLGTQALPGRSWALPWHPGVLLRVPCVCPVGEGWRETLWTTHCPLHPDFPWGCTCYVGAPKYRNHQGEAQTWTEGPEVDGSKDAILFCFFCFFADVCISSCYIFLILTQGYTFLLL